MLSMAVDYVILCIMLYMVQHIASAIGAVQDSIYELSEADPTDHSTIQQQ